MKRLIGFVFAMALAGIALAQRDTGRNYSVAPTDKDYKIVIVEPKSNATITGTDVQIVVREPAMPRGNREAQAIEDAKQKEINRPTLQIFVDGKDYGNLPTGQNVFVARGLSYGAHKIVVVAKNIANELVDRVEIPVTTIEGTASSTTTISEPQPVPAPAPAPEPKVMSREPAPAPPPSAPPAPQTLPQTGSVYPIVALLGVLLIGSGVILRKS